MRPWLAALPAGGERGPDQGWVGATTGLDSNLVCLNAPLKCIEAEQNSSVMVFRVREIYLSTTDI